MINQVFLIGRLTRNPELKYTSSGVAYCKFTLAVNRQVANKDGNREADFIECVAWRSTAENLAKYMSKGKLIAVVGKITTGSYQNQQGNNIKTFDVSADVIQYLESIQSIRSESNQSNQNQSNNYDPYQFMTQENPFETQQQTEKQTTLDYDVTNDDLPF